MATNSALNYCPSVANGCAAGLADLVLAACGRQMNGETIDKVFITEADAPGFTQEQWDDPDLLDAAITARIAQSGSKTVAGYDGNAAIRVFDTFDATKPISENATMTAFGGQTKPRKSPKSIDFVDYDASVETSKWHDQMNCGGPYKIWYTTGPYMNGGPEGIIVSFASSHGIVAGTDTPSESNTGRFTWSALRFEGKTLRPASI